MRSEFDKKRTTGDIKLGKDPETGIIILDEDPHWVYSREGAGNFFELRLDKEYGYVISFTQNDFSVFDYELGGNDNVINIAAVRNVFVAFKGGANKAFFAIYIELCVADNHFGGFDIVKNLDL